MQIKKLIKIDAIIAPIKPFKLPFLILYNLTIKNKKQSKIFFPENLKIVGLCTQKSKNVKIPIVFAITIFKSQVNQAYNDFRKMRSKLSFKNRNEKECLLKEFGYII